MSCLQNDAYRHTTGSHFFPLSTAGARKALILILSIAIILIGAAIAGVLIWYFGKDLQYLFVFLKSSAMIAKLEWWFFYSMSKSFLNYEYSL